jgi:hypothetical protein
VNHRRSMSEPGDLTSFVSLLAVPRLPNVVVDCSRSLPVSHDIPDCSLNVS